MLGLLTSEGFWNKFIYIGNDLKKGDSNRAEFKGDAMNREELTLRNLNRRELTDLDSQEKELKEEIWRGTTKELISDKISKQKELWRNPIREDFKINVPTRRGLRERSGHIL